MTLRIDPHAHTSHSDGTDSPRQLLAAAKDTGLDVVGITDHDTCVGWDEAVAVAPEIGVGVLRGVEVSCRADGITVHLLSFLHDPSHRELSEALEGSRRERVTRGKTMAQRLMADFPISWQDIVDHAAPGATIGRPHLADALIRAGVVANRAAAFKDLLHPSSSYYVPYSAPDAVAMTALVRDAGGVPVLAHPRAYGRQRRVLGVEVIEAMAEAGLFALEADHRDHGPDARREVYELAERLGLFVTGGSDYHGTGKPNRLGENLMAERVLAAMADEGYLSVVRA